MECKSCELWYANLEAVAYIVRMIVLILALIGFGFYCGVRYMTPSKPGKAEPAASPLY